LRASGRYLERTQAPEFPRRKRKNPETGKGQEAKKPVKKVVAKGKPVIARKNIFRVMFNEITPKAIKTAFEHPGQISESCGCTAGATGAGSQ
jgi:hypothetical protein